MANLKAILVLCAILLAGLSPLAFATGFKNPIIIPTPQTPSGLVVADINGDGKPDIIYANSSPSTLHVLLGATGGHFHEQFVTALPSGMCMGNCSLVLADVNNDGKLDIVSWVSNAGQNQSTAVAVMLGNGDGTFG